MRAMPDPRFHRLAGLPPYVLGEVDALKTRLRAAGRDVFDFGLGNPDRGSPAIAVERLIAESPVPANHRYAPSPGVPELRAAIARFYARRHGVTLDADDEAVATIGSKEGLGHLLLAMVAPGDAVLVPDPCYPIHRFGTLFAGGEVVPVPTGPGHDPVREYEAAYARAPKPPKLAIVNFPHNPTTATATRAELEAIVRWAERHDLWLISDLAYADLVFDGESPATSLLTIAGARARTCEFFTVSKSYNMPGWRVGFCVGNRDLVGALRKIKGYLDYGHFAPAQLGAVAALDRGDDAVAGVRALYRERRDALHRGLAAAGWESTPAAATMFQWARVPKRFAAGGSVAFAMTLLEQAGVAVAPGVAFGPGGEGFVRLALVEEVARIDAACRAIARLLAS
jgi:alanine-synthesizing transaminase